MRPEAFGIESLFLEERARLFVCVRIGQQSLRCQNADATSFQNSPSVN
jgi:hypothetical protein